jgi:UDP:flavonoid glycosyltransferase YjiC (YdhE family)
MVVPQPASIWNNGLPICYEDRVLLNRWRRRLGLPILTGRTIPEPYEATICLFPDWFGDPDCDSQAKRVFVGFPYLSREATTLPGDLESSIASHGPPVVFTAGTGVQDIEKFYRVARSFQAETGRHVFFISRFHHIVSVADSPLFRVLAFVDHALLFPRAAMVVHNGGIGTIAQAMRSAVPQVVVPLVWDQPDNAARIEALGLGQRIELEELSAEQVALALERFEAMDRQRLMLAAELVNECSAIAQIADHVERAMREKGRL